MPITATNDSSAHIIPSALGGRLKPKGLLSKSGNAILGRKFDTALVKALAPMMTLIGASRDRGENQPVTFEDSTGRRYRFEFGKPLRLTKPELVMTSTEDTVSINVRARTRADARVILGRVKKKHPGFDVKAALNQVMEMEEQPQGAFHFALDLSSKVTFPAAFATASLFSAHHGLGRHPEFERFVETYDIDQPSLPPDTFYWMPSRPWFSSDAKVAHTLALVGSVLRQELFAYVGLFDAIGIAVRMPYAGSSDVAIGYAVDVLTGKTVDVCIDEAAIRGAAWQATHAHDHLPDPTIDRFRSIMMMGIGRQREHRRDEIITNALEPATGRVLSDTDLKYLVHKVGQWIAPQIKKRTSR